MKKDVKILAFYSPYAGAGKTTAAQYILDTQPKSVWLSFADTLREIVDVVFRKVCRKSQNVSSYKGAAAYFEKDSPQSELGGHTYRDFLLAFGAAGRRLYPNIWVDCLKADMQDINGIENVVIDDLRFPNEYAMLRDKGAKIVRVTNPGRRFVPAEAEALLEGCKFDAEIVNNKLMGLNHYEAQIDTLLTTLWA